MIRCLEYDYTLNCTGECFGERIPPNCESITDQPKVIEDGFSIYNFETSDFINYPLFNWDVFEIQKITDPIGGLYNGMNKWKNNNGYIDSNQLWICK